MRPLVLHLLRRIALFALVSAGLLIAVPRLLGEMGVLGPGLDEVVGQASRAIAAAGDYGAGPGDDPFDAATAELEQARELGRQGRRREARRAAARSRDLAVEAQRLALVRREQARGAAERVAREVDRRLDDLEDAHDEVAARLDEAGRSRALSLMKEARQTGARLLLAYEEGDFGGVIGHEDATLAALAAAEERLRGLVGPAAGPVRPRAQARR